MKTRMQAFTNAMIAALKVQQKMTPRRIQFGGVTNHHKGLVSRYTPHQGKRECERRRRQGHAN